MSQEIILLNLIFGIILVAIASIAFAYGLILQKKAVMEMDEIKINEVSSMTAMLKNKTWRWGIIIALCGGIPFVFSQALIGVALSQPLMLSFQLAFLIIFAVKMLDEKLENKEEIIGFTLLIIAPLFLALGGVTPPNVNIFSVTFSLNFFLLFILPTIIICSGMYVLIKLSKSEVTPALIIAMISGLCFAMGAVSTQVGVELFKLGEFAFIFIGLLFFVGMLIFNSVATVFQEIAFQKKAKIGIAIGLQSTANLFLAIYGGLLIFNQQILYPIFFIIGIGLILLGNILLIQFQARLESIEDSIPKIDSNDNEKNLN